MPSKQRSAIVSPQVYRAPPDRTPSCHARRLTPPFLDPVPCLLPRSSIPLHSLALSPLLFVCFVAISRSLGSCLLDAISTPPSSFSSSYLALFQVDGRPHTPPRHPRLPDRSGSAGRGGRVSGLVRGRSTGSLPTSASTAGG